MIKKILVVTVSLVACLVAVAVVLYIRNPPPVVPPVSAADAATVGRPFVIKLHAQWCPVCMTTKGVWTDIEAAYASRVNLVVFDFTNEATSRASRAEAQRIGLTSVYEDNEGWTGTVLIVDGRTKTVTQSIHGSRDFAEYRTAIDDVLRMGGEMRLSDSRPDDGSFFGR